MPEGHVVHHQARRLGRVLSRRAVHADSPQGRFAAGAALVDGRVVRRVEAHGKHLFIGFATGDGPRATTWIHVHLGLFGKWEFGRGDVPDPVGQVRLRLRTDDTWAQLRGPTVCEVLDDAAKRAAVRRVGPDPIRPDADPSVAADRVLRSSRTVAELLMDQRVLSGVGNIYRAEVLFRHRVSPFRPGRDVSADEFAAMWADLVTLMRAGTKQGRIDTVRDEHLPEVMGRPPREDRHGGEVYVYRRAGQLCLVCGAEVQLALLGGRTVYWCPRCQPD